MKITGPDTRMIKIGPDEWVHVRGAGWVFPARGVDVAGVLKARLDAITSNSRVLILELVE